MGYEIFTIVLFVIFIAIYSHCAKMEDRRLSKLEDEKRRIATDTITAAVAQHQEDNRNIINDVMQLMREYHKDITKRIGEISLVAENASSPRQTQVIIVNGMPQIETGSYLPSTKGKAPFYGEFLLDQPLPKTSNIPIFPALPESFRQRAGRVGRLGAIHNINIERNDYVAKQREH